jgi:hypothetical protein
MGHYTRVSQAIPQAQRRPGWKVEQKTNGLRHNEQDLVMTFFQA